MPRNAPPSAMVGLDIGADSIKVVEAKYGKDGITITGLGMARTPEGVIDNEVIVDPKSLAAAIKSLLAESGIKTKQVTSSVAGQSRVVIRVIEVPKMAQQELAETMKWEVERQVPFPPNEVVMDYQPLEKPNVDPNAQNMEVLLAVAQEELITSHCEALQGAGLKPFAIDIEPLAVGRALLRDATNASPSNVVAIVNIGAGDTDLVIFENGQLTFPSPPLSIAGTSFTREISEALGQTLEQAETMKKEYASVKMGGFAQAASQPGPAQPDITIGPPPSLHETTSFNTSVGPSIQFASAFDMGDEPQVTAAGAADIAAEPANLSDFQNTIDGPVFDSPAGPTFDLGGDTAVPSASAADLGMQGDAPSGEAEAPAEPAEFVPATPVFDLDDEPSREEEQMNPSFDLSDADAHADPGDEAEAHAAPVAAGDSVHDQVFGAISGVLVDFATELRRSIEYYSTRYSRMPEKVLLCGGTAKMPHLDEFLTNELGMPVEVADPVKKTQVKVTGVSDRYLHEISPMFSVAIGLAIRDMVS